MKSKSSHFKSLLLSFLPAITMLLWSPDLSAQNSTSSPGTNSTISISIAVPERGGQRSIENRGQESHFHVILSNVSDQPQRLWREWCSWGYSALSFEISDKAGKTSMIKKRPKAWSKNYPDFCTLQPGETLVIDVYFLAQDVWDNFPKPRGEGEAFTIRAIYEVRSEEWSQKYSVWTGRVVSKAATYVLR